MTKYKPIVLVILDGWGYRPDSTHNAIIQARTSFFDYLWDTYPHVLLEASGESVGLPVGQIGTSEIGHMTIGAGRPIDTDLVRINKAIEDKTFHTNPAFTALFDHVKKYDSTLHIQGLVSPGGVHSHQHHLHEFLKAAKVAGVTKVVIHAFTDGRDLPPQSAHRYLRELEKVIEDLGIGFIATASGRFYAMERDQNWDRIAKVETALFEALGHRHKTRRPSEIIAELHAQGIMDEHLEPLVFLDDNGRSYPIQTNDGVFFFNFRPDRARMLSRRIAERSKIHNLYFVTLTEYDKTIESIVAFPPLTIDTTLSGEIAAAGLRQVHIAETEKYAHVTYFFNVGNEEPHQNELDVLIDSHKDVTTHDLAPEMRAKEITDKALANLEADFLIINYANADMVGHTANQPALLTALEFLDKQLKRLVEAVLTAGGVAIITADHGNAEINFDPVVGQKHTAHTVSPVPAILTVPGLTLQNDGGLADIAPTILHLLELKKPAGMTGKSLIKS